jgi:hypothetical protein
MDFVRLIYEKDSYSCKEGSNLKMDILGFFLSSDVGCGWSSFKEFAFNEWEINTSSNITFLRKENGRVLLSDLYSEESEPTELEMTVEQFIQLLDDWEIKVCKTKPKEVLIKYENGEFIIETKG